MKLTHAARRLHLQPLEDRLVPALSVYTRGEALVVQGTPGDDTIVVRRINDQFSVDGVTGTFAAGRVGQLIVNAGAGNDAVVLDSQDTPGQQPLGVPAYVSGGDGNDSVMGTPGNDTITGGNGDDQITGGGGNDYLLGDYGNDALQGAAGNDILYGGAGNDSLVAGGGRDRLDGGAGIDVYQDDYAAPVPSAGPDGVVRSIAARKAGDATWAAAGDIQQQVANTCSLLSSLAAFTRTSTTDLAARIKYDYSDARYIVPVYVNNQWTAVSLSFDGDWSDNDPYPVAQSDGSRDYWPILYQRAFLQAQNVDTSNPDSTQWAVRGTRANDLVKQSWRYPEVALKAVTGVNAVPGTVLSDTSLLAMENAVDSGHNVVANTHTALNRRPSVAGTGLVFSHTYAVVDVDDQARTVTLRNPWGTDAQSSLLAPLSPTDRAAFTMGNEGDGLVRVSWATFERAFAIYVIA